MASLLVAATCSGRSGHRDPTTHGQGCIITSSPIAFNRRGSRNNPQAPHSFATAPRSSNYPCPFASHNEYRPESAVVERMLGHIQAILPSGFHFPKRREATNGWTGSLFGQDRCYSIKAWAIWISTRMSNGSLGVGIFFGGEVAPAKRTLPRLCLATASTIQVGKVCTFQQ